MSTCDRPIHTFIYDMYVCQVNRSDGSWTYGKIMEYDGMGDTYTVSQRATLFTRTLTRTWT